MKKSKLLAKKKELEKVRDQLWNELIYVDQLMRKVGFSEGIETVKATALELSNMLNPELLDDEEEAA